MISGSFGDSRTGARTLHLYINDIDPVETALRFYQREINFKISMKTRGPVPWE